MSKTDDAMAMDTGPSPGLSAAPDRRGDGPGPAPRSPARAGGRPREGDWLNGQLRRLYDDVLNEPIPDDLVDLVGRLDEAGRSDGKDDSEADGSGKSAGDATQTRETSRS